MSTPDVRVRLSPEGVNEVIAALRLVQNEARKGNKAAAGELSLVQQAARDLKALLPTLGLAAAGAALIGLGKAALNTADATGKLQQKVGGTVEEVSALTLAFRTNESNQEQLQVALVKTSTLILQVQSGSESAAASLKAIGVNTQEFAKSSSTRGLEQIAKALQKIPPGAQRAAAAQKIFGKSSNDLLIALDAVGEKGIQSFIDKAREMGVLIDGDLASAAARAKDSIAEIGIRAEGVATQFLSGFAPDIAEAFEVFNEAVSGEGINGMRTLGEVTGKIIKFVVAGVVLLGKSLGEIVAILGAIVGGVGNAIIAVANLDFSAAKESLVGIVREIAEIDRATNEDMQAVIDRLATPPEATAKPSQTGSVTVDPDADAKKASAARSALARQEFQNELNLQKEFLRSQAQANQISYQQGLISQAQFFAKRRELQARESAAEIAALKAQRQAVIEDVSRGGAKTEEDKIKVKQQILTLDSQIAAKQVEARREQAALIAEEQEQRKRLGEEQAELATKLDELEGKRHAAFQRNLDEEIRQIQELGIRAGQTAEQIQAQVDRLTSARTSQFNFEEVQRQGDAALAAFTRDAAEIQRAMETHQISQAEGERRLIELERERLVVLEQMSAAMLEAAEATGNEDQIERARQYADSIREIGMSFNSATDFATQFKNAGIDAFQQGFEDFLANADKIENLGDAFKDLARTVVSSLMRMAAEVLAQQATFALLKSLGGLIPGGGFGGGMPAANAAAAAVGFGQTGGLIRGYEGGGEIWGAKLNIPGPDKIPLLGQEGEFMVRRRVAQQPGVLDFLRRLNGGQFRLTDAMAGVPRFAAGGLVGAGAGAGASSGSGGGGRDMVRVVNVLSEDLITQAMASSSGERVIVNKMERNEERLRRSR